jgi:hypothetical protein
VIWEGHRVQTAVTEPYAISNASDRPNRFLNLVATRHIRPPRHSLSSERNRTSHKLNRKAKTTKQKKWKKRKGSPISFPNKQPSIIIKCSPNKVLHQPQRSKRISRNLFFESPFVRMSARWSLVEICTIWIGCGPVD